ncbi:hypothetical protein YYE_00003 [Plasmodium vinckei vinckei]|nr:hypothetical protein YYE_00003 [Plasmodium vinckei vinckei]
MANSSYDIQKVVDFNNNLIVNEKYNSINNYCGSWKKSGNENCHNYIQLAICGFIYLLEELKNDNLEYDKLAEYAILWLSYKLNEAPKEWVTDLNDFYTNHIEKNNDYKTKIKDNGNTTYKDIIDKIKDLMNINELSEFNSLFYILFSSYYGIIDESNYCNHFLHYPISFVDKFKELNNGSKNIKDSLYSQILSTLSDDYKNLKKTYDDTYNYTCGKFPDLPKLNPKNPVEKSGIDSKQTLGPPSYNIKDVYSVFNEIDGYFYEKNENGGSSLSVNESINQYCNYENTTEGGNCHNDYLKMASSGVIYLLEMLKDKFDPKYDKLVEYAILWLSYKLNRHSKYSSTNLDDFYTKHIKTNNNYNIEIKDNGPTYKEIINKNKDLMNTKEISKFNYPFSILCSLYKGIKKNNLDCPKYSNHTKLFASNFEKLNNDSSIIGNASYRNLLSTLSDDYNNLKNKYCNDESCDFPTLSPVKTSSSSSIASKLIPGLSTFAIPAFLGVAYKYSLFGIDKLFQRQYIGKKLKKIKKKMNNYI